MMTDSVTYSVVMNGEIRMGYEPELVVNAFAKLFKITPEKANTIVGSKRTLKKGVNLKVAETYKQKLGSIGLEVVLKKHEPVKAEPQGLTLEPIQDEVQDRVEPSREEPLGPVMACPKCNLEQPKSEQCSGCGVYVHKVQKKNTENINSSAFTPKQEKVEQGSNYTDNESSQLKMYIAPVIVAILGALLWKLIAVTFDYELGLVAWLIGGAIGFSAAMVGAKGQMSGMACAVLVLLSIFGGKYLATASIQSDLAETIASATEYEGIELKQLYEEGLNDAKQFTGTVMDDGSLRKFMMDYGYSESYDEESITAEEIADFNEYIKPELEYMSYNQPGFEEWRQRTLTDQITSYSTFDWMIESLGLMDILFVILGIGTAFRLGSGAE